MLLRVPRRPARTASRRGRRTRAPARRDRGTAPPGRTRAPSRRRVERHRDRPALAEVETLQSVEVEPRQAGQRGVRRQQPRRTLGVAGEAGCPRLDGLEGDHGRRVERLDPQPPQGARGAPPSRAQRRSPRPAPGRRCPSSRPPRTRVRSSLQSKQLEPVDGHLARRPLDFLAPPGQLVQRPPVVLRAPSTSAGRCSLRPDHRCEDRGDPRPVERREPRPSRTTSPSASPVSVAAPEPQPRTVGLGGAQQHAAGLGRLSEAQRQHAARHRVEACRRGPPSPPATAGARAAARSSSRAPRACRAARRRRGRASAVARPRVDCHFEPSSGVSSSAG